MKIAIDARFLTHPQPGGFKTYTQNLIAALSQIDADNHYIIYVDRQPANGALPQQDNFTYKIVDGTLPVIGMPLREQFHLKKQITRDKPDVVHFLCNTAPIGLPDAYVLTLHDTIQVTNPEPFRLFQNPAGHKRWGIMAYSKWVITRTVQKAQKVITVSNYEREEIIRQLHVLPNQVCVTHLAPDTVFQATDQATRETWRAAAQRKYGLSHSFILGIGYEPRKNIPFLIDLFAQLASTHSELDLVIVVANEASRHSFARLVAEYQLSERVILLPSLPLNELTILYNLAELFVFPSERESFGLPPLEALACGTPTVAMAMTSLPEILGDGAILVEGKDVEIWASIVEQALLNKDLRQNLIQKGLERAAQLTWQQCARETIQVYHAAVAETRLFLGK